MLDIILFILVLIGLFLLFWLVNKKFASLNHPSSELNQFSQNISASLNQVAREIGVMQEIGRDMKRLQDFFKTPKLRGNIGEQILKDLLEQALPGNLLKFQHRFRSGSIVDALIKTNQGLIPIDSKFPLENFSGRDIRKHIKDISDKYILPQEGTVDFAVMYIPSENIYYQLLTNNSELLEFGYNNKVYIVSPNNFYYFLKVIMLGLEGAKIEETSRQVLMGFRAVEQEAKKLDQELSVLNRHLSNAKSSGERTDTQLGKLKKEIKDVAAIKISANKISGDIQLID